jgi:hypothetical protein
MKESIATDMTQPITNDATSRLMLNMAWSIE